MTNLLQHGRTGLLIPTDWDTEPGTVELGPTDQTAYAAIKNALGGGWLEAVPRVEGAPLPSTVLAYADEDGRLDGLPPNPRASAMTGVALVGPVVLVGYAPGNPETLGLTAADRMGLSGFLAVLNETLPR